MTRSTILDLRHSLLKDTSWKSAAKIALRQRKNAQPIHKEPFETPKAAEIFNAVQRNVGMWGDNIRREFDYSSRESISFDCPEEVLTRADVHLFLAFLNNVLPHPFWAFDANPHDEKRRFSIRWMGF